MIWKHEATLEGLQLSSAQCMPSHVGIEYTEIGADYILAKMPVDERTTQPFGILHGGASVVLAETLGSVAGTLCLDDPQTQTIVGVEINANHLRPAKKGEWVYGKVTPIKIGRTMQVWHTEITNDQGKKICVSRLTVAVIKR